MNTKLIMTSAALCLGATGILLSFVPEEVLAMEGLETAAPYPLFLQLLGALYFAFAMLNWMSKGGRIGGIYNRPIAVANFTHFLIGALALLKALLSAPQAPLLFWIVTGMYTLFALLFGLILYTHPLPQEKGAVTS